MHDPQTVAFEIKNPFVKKKGGYRPSLITIWHVDPETDGTDDSCGWFIRERHVDPNIIEKVVSEFESEWDKTFTGEPGFVYNCGWFNPEGENILSVQGIVFNMYLYAAKIALNPTGKIGPTRMWNRAWRFMDKNHTRIMYFAENNRDGMRDVIVRKFDIGTKTPYNRSQMIRECAVIITTDVLRRARKWYQEPRWHINHWKIQFHPWQQFKRKYFDKCCICGKRGFKSAAFGDWDGTKVWHQECDKSLRPNPNTPTP